MLGQASIMARVSLLVTLFPLAAGVAYLVRPTEQRLALMRPISLAGIFSGLSGAVLGLMNVLRSFAIMIRRRRRASWRSAPRSRS